jgi:uncharacterized protein (DUF1501 family)
VRHGHGDVIDYPFVFCRELCHVVGFYIHPTSFHGRIVIKHLQKGRLNRALEAKSPVLTATGAGLSVMIDDPFPVLITSDHVPRYCM